MCCKVFRSISYFLSSCVFERSRQSLKVREHKVLGPYVDGLSQLAVTNFEVGFLYVITLHSELHPHHHHTVRCLVPHLHIYMVYSNVPSWHSLYLKSQDPGAWHSGVAVVMWCLVYMPSLGRSFLSDIHTSPPWSSGLGAAWCWSGGPAAWFDPATWTESRVKTSCLQSKRSKRCRAVVVICPFRGQQ